ncbi:CBS and ACT domain-containing protein [Metallumcola ferriviriculae]|uniref:CBS and ACT domain-containing protein n=1 Tax=Metallumcola ferriviriculae TaxID=3039180 RepID=A0AAU0UNB9_9FIRM|nr:CBS and ACT domain-containing protein [Desulfitibacteraceae bacterium MK1]
MFVRDHMTSNPITIAKDMSVLDALELMRQHNIRRLPVTNGGKLLGLVTEQDLQKVSPSPASTLSVFEMNYLISKMAVKDVMNKQPATVDPDTPIEEAARIMRDEKKNELLVVTENQLLGIISQTDLFEALIRMFGFRRPGIRITLEVEDQVGVLANVTKIVKDAQINIISIANRQAEAGQIEVVLRLSTSDSAAITQKFEAAGYVIRHID